MKKNIKMKIWKYENKEKWRKMKKWKKKWKEKMKKKMKNEKKMKKNEGKKRGPSLLSAIAGVTVRLAFTSVWHPRTGSLTCRACRSSADFWPESPDPECFRVHSLSSHFMHVLFWRRCRWRYCGNFTSEPLLSASLHLNVKSQVVLIFQGPFPRQNSISSLELQSFHVDSIVLQVVFCELICT